MQFQGGVRLGGPLVSEVTHQYFEGMNPCSFYFFVRILAVFSISLVLLLHSLGFLCFALNWIETFKQTWQNQRRP